MTILGRGTTPVSIVTRATLCLGSIGYSIYLFGPIGEAIVRRALGPLAAGLPAQPTIALALAATCAIAAVVYASVEMPSIALGRRILASFGESPATGEGQIITVFSSSRISQTSIGAYSPCHL